MPDINLETDFVAQFFELEQPVSIDGENYYIKLIRIPSKQRSIVLKYHGREASVPITEVGVGYLMLLNLANDKCIKAMKAYCDNLRQSGGLTELTSAS